jgi:flagellin
MTVINTNIKGLYTQSALKISERASQVAMEQLSTGKRINSAKDDAAGMAIAARMTQQIRGLNQATRNAGDAISFIQTIEGATNEITNMLQRMSELAIQAANDTYSNEQRGFLDLEFQQLKTEIVRISEKYNWNGFKIMDGTTGAPHGPKPVTLTQGVAAVDDGSPTLDGLENLEINGVLIFASPEGEEWTPLDEQAIAAYDDSSNTIANTSNPARSAIAIADAINEKQSETGVRAAATGPVTVGTMTTVGTVTGEKYLWVNGVQIPITMSQEETPAERRANVISAINNTPSTGAIASDTGSGGVTLTTKDGRNLSVWFEGDTDLSAASFGLAKPDPDDPSTGLPIPGVTDTDPVPDEDGLVYADTLYGTVTLRSDTNHIILTDAMYDDLSYIPLDVGDTDQAGNPVPQYSGRMSFQVGPIADQVITIDMYDWGKNGALTGEVTGDVDRDNPRVNIRNVADANTVIDKLTRVMDKVNAKRADMGAVMNRLEHVIDNLTVVARNAEASRSQIEDADYAKASTELARTQIMQQAATAILAQANTSQQSVLKLLQG